MTLSNIGASLFPYDLAEIMEFFAAHTFRKGLAYYEKGAVIEFRLFDDMIHGSVQGTQRHPYTVELYAADGIIFECHCSCPVAENCKHCAALAIAAFKESEAQEANSASTDHGGESSRLWPVAMGSAGSGPQDVPGVVADQPHSLVVLGSAEAGGQLPKSTEEWIANLAITLAPPAPASKQPVAPERILYIWRHARVNWLVIDVVAARLLQSGGFGLEKDYEFRKMLAPHPAAFVAADDIAIARVMSAGQEAHAFYNGWLPKQPELMDVALKLMIATGRTYWLDKNSPPLKLGAARESRVEWQLNYDGTQSAVLIAPGENSVILYSASPWYVDEESRVAGPVVTDIPKEAAMVLLQAPPVAPAQAELFNRRLKEMIPHVALPAPRTDIAVESKTAVPLAVLRLKAETAPVNLGKVPSYALMNKDKYRPAVVPRAVLEFDYGGLFFDRVSGESRQLDGTRLSVVKRDFAGEAAMIERLKSIGFQQIKSPFADEKTLRFAFPSDNASDWLRFARSEVPLLKNEGWRVEVDPSFQFRTVEADDDEWGLEAVEEGGFWFSVALHIYVGGKKTPLMPILVTALKSLEQRPTLESIEKLNVDGHFMAPLKDGRMLILPFDRVRKVLEAIVELFSLEKMPANGRLRMSILQVSQLAGMQWQWLVPERVKVIIERLKSFAGIAPQKAPASFRAILRDYQQEGLGWLQFLQDFEFGGILADDMGLGKTVQALAHLLTEKEAGRLERPSLVVCPTSVVPNWIQEAERLAPKLKVLSLRGPDRHAHFPHVMDCDLAITTYPLLLRDAGKLTDIEWNTIILDEAQVIKNSDAQTTRIAYQLKANHRLCLTGTPVQNHLGELWSQFNFLMPGALGTEEAFTRTFREPIEEWGDETVRQALAKRLRPFLLRRTKGEVASELPPKSIIASRFDLEGDQRDLYETVRLAMLERVRKEIAIKGLKKSRIIILDALLKLRQICCDPRLLKVSTAKKVTTSAKLALLKEMLAELAEEGRRILLFSQFTSMLDLIVPELNDLHIPYVEIRGDTKDRATPVARFQDGDVPLFLLSLKAGGTGLNLTAADTVIHYDPWWNPAVEDQATDRAHRIGQDKPVFVYKLIALDTIEERMLELQERKRAIAEVIYDEQSGTLPLDESDLEMLFAPIR